MILLPLIVVFFPFFEAFTEITIFFRKRIINIIFILGILSFIFGSNIETMSFFIFGYFLSKI